MTKKFQTKIIYFVVIIVLLIPLFLLGKPAAVKRGQEGETSLTGGYLAELRIKEDIIDAQLGKIDPGSSTIKLATFGMRGVALAMLWHQLIEDQKKFDWNNVIVLSNQVTALEPRFISTWQFLAWNAAYNGSVAFDDYRERYRWVIRGFEFLTRGTEYNSKAPLLYSDAGWTISQKIGIADEKEQYRRLFRQDDAFHELYHTPSIAQRDNWLFGIPWYQKAEDIFKKAEAGYYDKKDNHLLSQDEIDDFYQNSTRGIKNKARPIFMVNSRMNLIHYAEWYELDGNFGEKAKMKWNDAERAWKEFAKLVIPTTIDDRKNPGEKRKIALEEAEAAEKKEAELRQKLVDMLAPRTPKEIYIERWNALTDAQKGSLLAYLQNEDPDETYKVLRAYLNETMPDWENKLRELQLSLISNPDEKAAFLLLRPLRDKETSELADKANRAISEIAAQANSSLQLTPDALAIEIARQDAEKGTRNGPIARQYVKDIEDVKYKGQLPGMFCDILNYQHHSQQIAMEQTQEAVDAHSNHFDARKQYKNGDIYGADKTYLDMMNKWNELMGNPKFAFLKTEAFRRDFIELVDKYRAILEKLGERGGLYPEPFPFEHLVRLEVNQYSKITELQKALRYVQDEVYQKGDYAKAAKYSRMLLEAWHGVNESSVYMKQVPVPEYRDSLLETIALYVRSVKKSGEEFDPKFPFFIYVNLVMTHDPLTIEATKKTTQISAGPLMTEVMKATTPISAIPTEKTDAFLNQLADAAADWGKVIDRYPLVLLKEEQLADPANPLST
ncbi:MAG: hypothetical protein FWC50_15755, partial [Planctomycetaceae bacterium]|nr:hypothetical protein [Planctomycetaceae bacterium]